MRHKIYAKKAVFEYGSLNASQLTILDIKQCYLRLGGKIEPNTEVEFSSYFPGTPYDRTSLTNRSRMPPTYLCEGSITTLVHQPDGRVDTLSLSVYKDTSGHEFKGQPIGDHHNLFLQYEINDKKTHTDDIPNRHIPLQDGVMIKALLADREVKKVKIKPR